MRSRGLMTVDAHKQDRPRIPQMGGLAVLAGISASIIISSILAPRLSTYLLVFLAVILIAGYVGALDDLVNLNPVLKPMLVALACLPILLFHAYSPHPTLPFVGDLRLSILYPILIPFAIAVPANAINMVDVLNGVMTGVSSIAVATLLVCSLLFGSFEGTILCASLLGALLAFHKFNKYPSQVFPGDVGSLSIGAGIGALTVLSRLEVVGIVVLMVPIMNAFYILTGLSRFSRHELWPRPTKLLEDGRLSASEDPEAPLTMTRLIVARKPMTEPEIIRSFFVLTALCSVFALVTAFMMWVT